MSEIRTPPSLKWLLDKRARVAGEIEKLQETYPEKLADAEKRFTEAWKLLEQSKEEISSVKWKFNKQLETLTADLEAIDRTMKQHEIQVAPDLIPPIRFQGDQLMLRGDLTRAIYDCLGSAEGVAKSTSDVALYVASLIDRGMPDKVFTELRYSVRHRLKRLCSQGKVIKTNTPRKGVDARWRLPNDGSLPAPSWEQKTLFSD